jgi:hypothetical protein
VTRAADCRRGADRVPLLQRHAVRARHRALHRGPPRVRRPPRLLISPDPAPPAPRTPPLLLTGAGRSAFHESPYLRGDSVMTADEDSSGLLYFSACERQVGPPPRGGAGRGEGAEGVGRQNLMEHIIENKIREAVARHRLSPKTAVNFFPLHDADGEGDADLAWLAQHWAVFFRPERWLAPLKLAANPHRGLEEPLEQVGPSSPPSLPFPIRVSLPYPSSIPHAAPRPRGGPVLYPLAPLRPRAAPRPRGAPTRPRHAAGAQLLRGPDRHVPPARPPARPPPPPPPPRLLTLRLLTLARYFGFLGFYTL